MTDAQPFIETLIYKTPYGQFTAHKLDALVARAMERDGCWEPELMHLAIRETQFRKSFGGSNIMTIIDVGAHIGLFTIPLLLANPNLRAVCIEPNPMNVMLLRKNIADNGLTDRVTVHECAVGSYIGEATFTWSVANTMDHRALGSGSDFDEGSRPTSMVSMTTIDMIVSPFASSPPYLLKLDTQGTEQDVLAGAPCTLRRTKTILLELWPYGIKSAGATVDDLIYQLEVARFTSAAVVQSRDVAPVEGAMRACMKMVPSSAHGFIDLVLSRP